MGMFLFLVGFFGFLISAVMLIINLFRKKPKKNLLKSLGICFVLVIVGSVMVPPTTVKEPISEGSKIFNTDIKILEEKYADLISSEKTRLEELQDEMSVDELEKYKPNLKRLYIEKMKEENKTSEDVSSKEFETEFECKLCTMKGILTKLEESLLKKSYADYDYTEKTIYNDILEKMPKLTEETQKMVSIDLERLKKEKDNWDAEQEKIRKQKEQERIEQEKKEWQEYVAKNTKKLSAGEHFVGKHISEGVYDVTFSGSGNFVIYASNGELLVNEIGGGSYGISKYRAILTTDSKIKLSGVRATFKPIKREAFSYSSFNAYSGYWIVGQDVTKGRYTAKVSGNNSGNFIIYSERGLLKTNEVLGGPYGVSEVVINLDDGDIINIGGLRKVSFVPTE